MKMSFFSDLGETPFNISLESLMRINGLIKDLQNYGVNYHVIAFKNNLYELKIECIGFLDAREWGHSEKLWAIIEKYEIEIGEDTLIYKKEIWQDMNKLRVYLIGKLYSKKILFLSNTRKTKTQRIREKYNLGGKDGKGKDN